MVHSAGDTGAIAWANGVDANKLDKSEASSTYGRLEATPTSLAIYGVLPAATAAVNSAGLATAAASGLTNFFLPAGTYQVTVPLGGTLMTFTSKNHVKVRGDNAVLNDTTTHTNNGAFSSVVVFDACNDVEVSGIDYVGQALGSPSTLLGYQGAIFVRAINGTDGVKVDARLTNLRYGVQTGEYGDATKGQCRNFDVKIRGTMVGYAIAAYYATGIRHDLDVDGVHRVAYFAGCDDVTGVARFRDQYIADTAYLITDTLTSGTDAVAQVAPPANPTTSKGSSNFDATVIDKGSTVFQPNSTMAAIGLQRVDPCAFRNIKVRVYSVGATDTISTKMGAFRIVSNGVPAIWSRYPGNWEPTVIIDNVEISGVVDHSAATLAGNTGSEFYVYCKDDIGGAGHAPTVSNIRVNGLTILPSTAATPRASYFIAPSLTGSAKFLGFRTPGLGMIVQTNLNVATTLEGCTVADLDVATNGASRVILGAGTTVTSQAGVVQDMSSYGGTVGGAAGVIKQKETTLTLAGANTTWAAAIPAGSILLGVTGRIQTAITGASGIQVGVTGDLTRFKNGDGTAVGTTFGPASQAATEVSPKWYFGATAIVVTARTANFTGGTLRLVITYMDFGVPTA